MLRWTCIFVIGTCILSCGKDEGNPPLDFYETYYPLSSGVYVDYYVQEIIHDDLAANPHDTSNYYLRTLIEDTIIDNQGRLAYKFIRMKRTDTTDTWQISDVWTTIKNNNKIELTEENRRMVKLILPPNDYTIWDANIYNTLNAMNCFYEDIHQPFMINSLSFDSTLKVHQEDILNLVAYKKKYEVYANHVGLVKKYYKDLVIANFDTLNISSGTELIYNCIDFGIE
jgi:hypothetical protein